MSRRSATCGAKSGAGPARRLRDSGSTSSSWGRQADPARHGRRGDPQHGERDARRHSLRTHVALRPQPPRPPARRRRTCADKCPKDSRSTACLACAAVTHSSIFLRVKNKRDQRAHDRVRHQPGLVGQKRDRQPDLREAQRQDPTSTARKWLRLEIPPKRGLSPTRKGISGGNRDRGQHKSRPHPGERCGMQPSRRPGSETWREPKACGADCRSSSSGRWRESESAAPCFGTGRRARKSRAEVASRRAPSGAGARRRLRSATGNSSKSSISVARAVRAKMPSKRSWLSSVLSGTLPASAASKGVDVVNSFAGVRAFAKKILIHIGNGGDVRIDPAGTGKDLLENASLRGRWAAMGVMRGCTMRVAVDHARQLSAEISGD